MELREIRVFEHEGQKIFGVLHIPKGEGPFPTVVMHHGFAGHKVGNRRLYVQQAEAFSRAGIATFRFDFRGCGDSEGSFEDITLDSLVSDSLWVLQELAREPQLDRFGLLGVSLGGSVALLAAQEEAPVQSLALWAPVAIGEVWHEDYARTFPEKRLDGYLRSGGESASMEFCAQFLMLRAHEVLGELPDLPLLHVHGEKDDMVYPSHAEAFQEARGNVETLSRFLRLPNSNHDFTDHEDRQVLIEETTRWFQETL